MKTKMQIEFAKAQVFYIPLNRRRFFKSMALASAGFTLPGYLAEALTITPQVTQGPYYPLANNIPLDKDNDLVQLNDNASIANGIITYLSGRVLDSSGVIKLLGGFQPAQGSDDIAKIKVSFRKLRRQSDGSAVRVLCV